MGAPASLTPAGSNAGAAPDYTAGTHNEGKCSYKDYVGHKFYEYAALFEMIYALATDKNLRAQLFDNFDKSEFMEWQKARNRTLGHTYEYLKERYFGDPKKAEAERAATQKGLDEWQQHKDATFQGFLDALGQALTGYWKELTKRFHECGLSYAIGTLTIDGAFTLGELAIGDGVVAAAAKTLKSLKFIVSKVGEKVLVRVMNPKGGEVTRSFAEKDLAAKYGKPEESHTGGVQKDVNRPVISGKKLTQAEYDALRKKTPSAALRKQVNEGQPVATPDNPVADPWLPGKNRTGPLAADHVVSMKTITEMDGFADLTAENQMKVLNDPENFTGLSKSANSSKGAKSFSDWKTYGTGSDSIPVDPGLRQQMIEKSREVEPKLQKKIYDLLREQQKEKGQGGAPFRGAPGDKTPPGGKPTGEKPAGGDAKDK